MASSPYYLFPTIPGHYIRFYYSVVGKIHEKRKQKKCKRKMKPLKGEMSPKVILTVPWALDSHHMR